MKTRMLMVYITSILINYVSSTRCTRAFAGSFQIDDNGTCGFDCTPDVFVPFDNLTFNEIKRGCDNIRYTNSLYPTDCNSTNDLVWRNDSCSCPFCKCSQLENEQLFIEPITWIDFLPMTHPVKECISCACSEPSSDYGINGLIHQCDLKMEVDNFLKWNDYACPPNTCKDSNNNTKEVDEYWWENVTDDNTLCQEFCYCSGTDGKICATGYDNIMANDKLKIAFIENCGSVFDSPSTSACYIMNTTSYDTSRLFTTETGPECIDTCPKCDCDGHYVGDTWLVQYQEYFDISTDNGIQCALCECKLDDNGNKYANCEWNGGYGAGDFAGTCSNTIANENQYVCHEEGSFSGSVGELGLRTCAANTDDGSSDWCNLGSANFATSISWGCGDPIICEAFANQKCVWYDWLFESADCDGNVEDLYIGRVYDYCCLGDNCNYKDLNTSECTQSIELGNYVNGYFECLFGPRDDESWDIECDDDKEELTCNDLLLVFKQRAGCICTEYSEFYDLVSQETQLLMQKELDIEFGIYSEWNDIFGCDINLQCDLETGGQVINIPTTSSPMTTIIVTEKEDMSSKSKKSGSSAIAIGLIVGSLMILFGCIIMMVLYNKKMKKKAVVYDTNDGYTQATNSKQGSDKGKIDRVRSRSDVGIDSDVENDKEEQDTLKINASSN